MKTIYRIEYKDGYGAFTCCIIDESFKEVARRDPHIIVHFEGEDEERPKVHFLDAMANRAKAFDRPGEEGLDTRKDGKVWWCAYKSLSDLHKWVKDDEIAELVKVGYKILELEVNEYQEGHYQIVYTKESIIKSTDISNLLTKT